MLQVGFTTTSSQTHQRAIWWDWGTYSPGPYQWYWIEKRRLFSIIPISQCGNGVVETGEQCDGGVCCTAACKFVAAGTVCRGAAGECDEPEMCSGSSANCPSDVFSLATKDCGEKIGFCDARINNKCPGNSPICNGVPYVRFGTETFFYDATWENYNVISFGSFNCPAGQVEGRLAVRNNVNLGGFSIGYAIDTTSTSSKDRYVPYGLLVGGSATWTSGTLWPDESVSHPSRTEYIGVSGTFNAPTDLQGRQLIVPGPNGGVVQPTPNIQGEFDKAKTYYTRLQNMFSAATPNAAATLQWGGLFVHCADPAANFYYVDIQGADLSQSTWWNLENCNFQAVYVLNIRGSGAVSVQGGDFPTITERVIYNVVGTGRTFTTSSGLNGNILAPNNIVKQNNGVTKGLVIAGDMPTALHSQNPNCINFDPIRITGRVAGSIIFKNNNKRDASSLIPVYSVGLFSIGDQITLGSETVTITGAESLYGFTYLEVQPAVTGNYATNTEFTTIVDDPLNANRPLIEVVTPSASNESSPSKSDTEFSSASTLAVFTLLNFFFAAVLLL